MLMQLQDISAVGYYEGYQVEDDKIEQMSLIYI